MSHRAQAIFITAILVFLSIVPLQGSAIDLEGGSSKVTVRSIITIDSDGMIRLDFKVLWGESEFEDSNIFHPRVVPPSLPWSDLTWDNLSGMITPISTIQYLFESTLSDGLTIVESEEHFIETVLDIDVSFTVKSIQARVLTEFQTIEITARLDPSESSYTLSPLKFLSDIDFQGYPPKPVVEIKTGPSISLRSSSFALNHYLLPEGHRFNSGGLLSIEDGRVTYDPAEDSIHVRKLPPVMSSTLLYSLWVGSAFLSMVLVAVSGKRAKKRVNKGGEMWFAIGMVCFFAFLPYHLYLSLILIVLGFYYSVKKSRSLRPTEPSSDDEKDEEQVGEKEIERKTDTPLNALVPKEESIKKDRPLSTAPPPAPIQPEELNTLIPPPLPLKETTVLSSDPSFAPPSHGVDDTASPTQPHPPISTSDELEQEFSRPSFLDENEHDSNNNNNNNKGPEGVTSRNQLGDDPEEDPTSQKVN